MAYAGQSAPRIVPAGPTRPPSLGGGTPANGYSGRLSPQAWPTNWNTLGFCSAAGSCREEAPPPGRMSLTPPQRNPLALQSSSSPASQANSQPSSQPPSQPPSQPQSAPQSAPMSPRGQALEACSLPPPQPAEASSGSRGQPAQFSLEPVQEESCQERSSCIMRSLEPVQEESCQASIERSASVQELREQLLAERSWWQKTSAAQVTQQVDQLRRDLETQQVTLAKIAEHLLANGAPQIQSVEASLNECRALVLQQQQAQELQANALREGLLEIHQQRAALEKEIHQARETRGVVEGSTEVGQPFLPSDTDVQALDLHKHLAKELSNAIHRFDDQGVHLSQAIETERLARIGEVTELRKVLEDTSVQKAYIERTIGAFLERADQIEQKLGTSSTIRDSHNVLFDVESLSARVQAIEASASKVDTNGPPLKQVLAMIRDAQEMLRFEFAARLAEIEMRVRDQSQPPAQPRADADELAQRLEAIKSQLRAEIEKRIERSPSSAPLLDNASSPKKNSLKAASALAARTIV